jgi:lysophospholipase L1-like esterase
VRQHPTLNLNVTAAADDLMCSARGGDDAIKIACVGDSITAGVCSSGGDHPYPQQLQKLLDAKHGPGKYAVTNLGACGSTMLKKGNSPFWKRPQYDALTKGTWDIVTIMLGTNDAKDPGDHGPDDWQHDCGGPSGDITTKGCSFASDYQDMISLVGTLGTTGASPKIYPMVPPPLMQQAAYGMNQTVINDVYPKLVPLIARDAGSKAEKPIDIYGAMGGTPNWRTTWPASCALDSPAPCPFWCDKQHCDQCHPNDDGYAHLAEALLKGLGL